MELSVKEQIINLISNKDKILILAHAKPDGDTISASLALFLVLKKLGKTNVELACSDSLPEVFDFLPATENFTQKKDFPKDTLIKLDVGDIDISRLRWSLKDSTLSILISPNHGEIQEQKPVFEKLSSAYSLIITVDVADREQLGDIFFENPEMITESTIVNIDHHVSNTNFGTVNMVDGSSASCTEVLYELILETEKHFGKKLMDDDIATLLLTGIITDTGSFQNPNTTPKSFEVSAELVEMGARQQEIIRHLFKTKNLSTLKLWGKVLSKIKNDPIHRFVWSSVSMMDLVETQATSDELKGILDDLLSSAPGAEVVLLLKEREDGIISGSLRTTSNAIDAVEIAEIFGGGGHRQAAGFKIKKDSKSFDEISFDVIDKIKSYQSHRLGILPQKIQPIEKKPENPVIRSEKREEKVLDFSFMANQKTQDITPVIKSPKPAPIVPKPESPELKKEDIGKFFEEVKTAVSSFSVEKLEPKAEIKDKPKVAKEIKKPAVKSKKQEPKKQEYKKGSQEKADKKSNPDNTEKPKRATRRSPRKRRPAVKKQEIKKDKSA
jgi:phosphoesterase RecJ-like protein